MGTSHQLQPHWVPHPIHHNTYKNLRFFTPFATVEISTRAVHVYSSSSVSRNTICYNTLSHRDPIFKCPKCQYPAGYRDSNSKMSSTDEPVSRSIPRSYRTPASRYPVPMYWYPTGKSTTGKQPTETHFDGTQTFSYPAPTCWYPQRTAMSTVAQPPRGTQAYETPTR